MQNSCVCVSWLAKKTKQTRQRAVHRSSKHESTLVSDILVCLNNYSEWNCGGRMLLSEKSRHESIQIGQRQDSSLFPSLFRWWFTAFKAKEETRKIHLARLSDPALLSPFEAVISLHLFSIRWCALLTNIYIYEWRLLVNPLWFENASLFFSQFQFLFFFFPSLLFCCHMARVSSRYSWKRGDK